ncbi:MAG: RNA 2',3'-cyclic phosphodiesterase [Micromonosporaceae bacterium]
MGTQRLFVAVDPPQYAVDHLAAVVSTLHVAHARARLSATERWHLTVAFLGEIADDRVDAAREAVAAAASGPSAHAHELWIAGGGKFGGGAGSILWAGIGGEVDRLRQLARAVGRSLRAARFKLERRPYRPHLTIARPGTRLLRTHLSEDIATLATYHGPPWPVTELHLIRSHPGPTPHFVRVASFPL